MSDDHGDAEFEASLAGLGGGHDTGAAGAAPEDEVRSDPGDPSLLTRLESVHGTLSTLGMRIDALVTSTTSYRSALTDRLTEYSELVVKSARTQAADLEEYRRTTERTITEVRRSLAATEEAIGRVGARVDELAAEDAAEEGDGRRVLAEVRGILDAQERLSEFLTQSLDRFGATVVEHLERQEGGVAEEVAQVRAMLQTLVDRDPHAGVEVLEQGVAQLRSSIDELSGRDLAGDVVRAVSGDLESVRSLAEGLAGADVAGQVSGLVAAELGSVRDALDDLRTRDVESTVVAAVENRLSAVMDALEQLRDRDIVPDVARAVAAEVEPVRAVLEEIRSSDGAAPLTRDLTSLREELAVVGSVVEQLRADDVAAAVRVDLQPIAAVIDSIADHVADGSQRVQVLEHLARLEEHVGALAGVDRVDEVLSRLGELASTTQVDRITGTLRAHLEDALAGLDGQAIADDVSRLHDALASGFETVRTVVTDELGSVREELTSEVEVNVRASARLSEVETRVQLLLDRSDDDTASMRALLDTFQETSIDLASGEVVGALWDEVRAVREGSRADADELRSAIEELRAALAPAPAAAVRDRSEGEPEFFDEVRNDLAALRASLDRAPSAQGDAVERTLEELAVHRSILEAVRDELVSETSAPDPDEGWAAEPTVPADSGVAALEELREQREILEELREELAAVRTASDEVATMSDELRSRLGDLDSRSSGGGVDADLLSRTAEEVASLRADLAEGLVIEPADSVAAMLDGLRVGLRDLSDVPELLEDVQSRLDSMSGGSADAGGDAEMLADVLAGVTAIKTRLDEGLVLAEDSFAGLESTSVIDQLAELRDNVAGQLDVLAGQLESAREEIRQVAQGASSDAAVVPSATAFDPDVLDALRTEIRDAGGVSDAVVDALREELKALRRRIAVKAQEKVLSEDQLAEIAEAVAARLAGQESG